MRIARVCRVATGGLLAASLCAAQAGPFDWLKAGRASGKAAHVAAAAPSPVLTPGQLAAMASGLDGEVIHVEARGSRLLVEGLDDGGVSIEGKLDELESLTGQTRGAAAGSRPKYLMSTETAAALGSRLDKLMEGGTVHVPEPFMNTTLSVVRHAAGERVGYFRQLRKNVLVPLDARIGPEVARALSEPVRREGMRVVSMFAPSDVDALHKLAAASGDALLDTALLWEALRKGSLQRLGAETLIVVGHVEHGAFVARAADGSVQRLGIQELERLSAASDVQLLSAGCSSFCNGASAGYADPVTDADMAQAVNAAFAARTTADLLEAFGQRQPLVVTQGSLDRFATSRTLHLQEMDRGAQAVDAGTIGVRFASKLRDTSTEDGGWLSVLVSLYTLGFVAIAAMYKTSRRAFLHVYPRLPSPRLPELRLQFHVARARSALLFLTLAPLFAVLVLVTFFVGGWSYRQRILAAMWRCVAQLPRWLGYAAIFVVVLAAWGTAWCRSWARRHFWRAHWPR